MTQIPRDSAQRGAGQDGLHDLIEVVRNCSGQESVPDVLHAAASLVEHAAYVTSRHSSGGPVTRLMLLAAELESIGNRLKPGG
ncbi:hypothetical protein [Antarctobacter heliothermus]|uniref:Uncharacterized protein n=1 Tax=Antarctobacter heliothermus TaxID=74033 RepID=A0A239FGK4_9RHOB|nr:hypothetical protein [Antarctobacter heliothermus]SNS55891.1 hypothetical protein SAMN04488078_102017 [Antarctobacter heliothermus]